MNQPSHRGSFLAGAARVDVSPRQPVFLCGFPYAQRISTGVHDPLYASALCLRNGEAAALLVAVDNLFVNPWVARAWRKAVRERTGLDEAAILISCSHTHSGPHTADVIEWGPSPVVPAVDPTYLAFLEQGIVQAAAEAASSLQPARLAWTSARVDGVGCNRHDPEHGARDPEVSVLAVRHAENDNLIALDLTYAMHPTVLHEDSTLVSSDFPGLARLRLEELIGRETVILYHNGPAGNQSPRWHVKAQTFAEAERLGRRLVDAVWPAVQEIKAGAYTSTPVLGGAMDRVSLPWRKLPPVAEARRQLDEYRRTYARLKIEGSPHGPLRTAECDVFGAHETLYYAECFENGSFQKLLRRYDPLDAQVVRVGEACLVGYPGELFVEYGLMTKWQSPCRAVPINLVNGETQGYIVTPAAIREGRYETHNRSFAPEAGEILVRSALRLIHQLHSRTESPQAG